MERSPVPEIRKILHSLGLAFPTKEELIDLESEVIEAADPKIHKYLCNTKIKKSKGHLPFLTKLVNNLQLHPYFDLRLQPEKCFHILQCDELRTALEGLLMTSLPVEEIVTLIGKRWNFPLSKEEALWYRHLFWDIEGVEPSVWARIIARCSAKGAAVRIQAVTNPYDVTKVRWMCGLSLDVEYNSMLSKSLGDTFMHLNKAFDANYLDVSAASKLTVMMTRLGSELKRWGGEQSVNQFVESVRIIENNRERGRKPVPAPIYTALPPVAVDPKSSLTVIPASFDKKKA